MTIENLFVEVKQLLHKFYKDRFPKDSNAFYDFEFFNSWYSLVFIIFEDRHSQYKRINENELLSVLKNFINSVILSEMQFGEIDNIIYSIHDRLPVRIIIKMWGKKEPVQYNPEEELQIKISLKENWTNRLYKIIKRSYDTGLTLDEITIKSQWINNADVRYELLERLLGQQLIEKYLKRNSIVYRKRK
jgi:6-pyruvoyl-tetrahydropterin synthase